MKTGRRYLRKWLVLPVLAAAIAAPTAQARPLGDSNNRAVGKAVIHRSPTSAPASQPAPHGWSTGWVVFAAAAGAAALAAGTSAGVARHRARPAS